MKSKIKTLLFVVTMAVAAFAMSLSAAALEEMTVGDWRIYAFPDSKNAYIEEYVGSATEITVPSKLGDYKVVSIQGIGSYKEDSPGRKVTKITIPASVESTSGGAYCYCNKLTTFAVASGSTYYTAVNGVLYTKDKKEIVAYPQGKTATSFSVPSGTVTVGRNCFESNAVLTSVTLPSTVKKIDSMAFYQCKNLTKCAIPSSVTTIGNNAFYGTGFTEFTVPATVTALGTYVFDNCDSLQKATINAPLKELPTGIFNSCDVLTSVTLPKTLTTIGKYAFHSCEKMTGFAIPSGVTVIDQSAFEACTSLTSVTIPETVKKIGTYAFGNCISLTSVTIPKSVTEMGDNPFVFDYNLKTITIASGNTAFKVSDGVLFNAAKSRILFYSPVNTATTYTIPSTVKSIDNYAFARCNNLTSMVVPYSVNNIGLGLFKYCSNLTYVDMTGSISKIPQDTFASCYKLANIVIPNSITEFASYSITGMPWDASVKILYGGTEAEWKKVKLGSGNKLEDMKVVYNYLITPQMKKVTNVVSGAHVYWWDIGTTSFGRYDVYRAESEKGTYSLIGKTTASNYTDTTAQSGKTYYYKVKAARSTKTSNPSKAVSTIFVTTPDITSRVNKAAGVTLGWNKITGATGYAIYRKGDSASATWARVATTAATATSWTDTSVKSANGTIYHYTIRALAGSDKSILSGCRSTGRTVVRLSSPVLSSAAKASSTAIKAAWGRNTAATGYEVRIMNGTTVVKTVSVTSNATVTSTVTGLSAGKTYKVQVRSYKTVGGAKYYSAWSEAKSLTL